MKHADYFNVYEDEKGVRYLHFATSPMNCHKILQSISNPDTLMTTATFKGYKLIGDEKSLGYRK